MEVTPHTGEMSAADRTAVIRRWNGVTLEEFRVHETGPVLIEMVREDATGLTLNLNEVGGYSEPRLAKNRPSEMAHRPFHMALVPQDVPLWGYSDVKFIHYAILTFDAAALARRFGEAFTERAVASPRVPFHDSRITALVRMLLDISGDEDAAQLLGDSLTAAIFAILAGLPEAESARPASGLAPWQLRRVTEYMVARLPERVELTELAELVGLSQWHFCRAFKAATGTSPYQWQLDRRIELAKTMLMAPGISVEAVAECSGFTDAVHFSKTFRRRVGEAPAAWRRQLR